MRKKLIVTALLLVSSVIFLPGESFAASSENNTSMTLSNSTPQIRVQIGRRNRGRHRGWERGRHRGWERGRHRGWENRRNRTRVVQQVYWRNGRRYVRTVRVRY